MADSKVTKPVESTSPWDSPKETWQFITLPDEDPLGKPFPTIRLNKDEFKRGQVYSLPVQIADYVKDRIKAYNRSCVRLLQPDMAQDGIIRTADGASAPMPTL